jgi:hypothetical protein
MADGVCPSCGKDTNNRAGVDPTKVLVGIHSGRRLPGLCHWCGNATTNTKRVSAASEPQDTTIASGFGEVLAQFIRPFGIFDRLERSAKRVELRLTLPTCKECARHLRLITPHYIDFDAHRIDLVVHVEFKKAMDGFATSTGI